MYENSFQQTSKNTVFKLSDKITFGRNVVFGKECKYVEIGYGCFLGNDLYIDVPELIIGDYTTIHRGTSIHGYRPCNIGHNCWIGQFSILDSIGGLLIGNNVGIGAHSQLWSHIKFGDTLEGCRWNKAKKLIVEDDVWFVGHCIVSPIVAQKKSMLLVGGVITKDMKKNHVYAGVPAKDITNVVGLQFNEVSYEEKVKKFEKLYFDFLESNNMLKNSFQIEIVKSFNNMEFKKDIVYFNLYDRTYIPLRNEIEYRFMKYLLYDKAKFIPIIA